MWVGAGTSIPRAIETIPGENSWEGRGDICLSSSPFALATAATMETVQDYISRLGKVEANPTSIAIALGVIALVSKNFSFGDQPNPPPRPPRQFD
jgi:hypothetical protein